MKSPFYCKIKVIKEKSPCIICLHIDKSKIYFFLKNDFKVFFKVFYDF